VTYRLIFKKSALKEWKPLAPLLKKEFKKKLLERLDRPRVEASRLNGLKNCYKIKLRSVGYRLVYEVRDADVIVVVVVIAKLGGLHVGMNIESKNITAVAHRVSVEKRWHANGHTGGVCLVYRIVWIGENHAGI
jgi:mRNA interferase RelE/StbE